MRPQDVIEQLSAGMCAHERMVNKRLVAQLVPHFRRRLKALSINLSSLGPAAGRRQLFAFLKFRVSELLTTAFDLRRRYNEYTKRFSRAVSADDKERHILDFARELGATRRQLRGDRKAFTRHFGHDAVTERYVRRTNWLEREMSFLLERTGVVAHAVLTGEGAGGELGTAWDQLGLERTLKPFFAYDGDSRVTINAFRCLARALRALPAEIQEHCVDEGTLQFIYRSAMHTRLDVWLQCEALCLLESLSPTSLLKVITRRLQSPAGDDDLFVRRRAVELVGANLVRIPELAALLPTAAKDQSIFVRQGFAEILPRLPSEIASAWFQCLSLEDRASQVRAAVLLAGLSLLPQQSLRRVVFSVVCQVMAREKDTFVLRMATHVASEGIRILVAAGDPHVRQWAAELVESLEGLHTTTEVIPVKRWAALARERVLCEVDEEARQLRDQLSAFVSTLKEGERKRLPSAIKLPDRPELLGRVLAVLSQNDFGYQVDYGWGRPHVTRGHPFVFKPWRLLHEVRNPSPDKRQAFAHTVARGYRGDIYAPSAILAELAETRVPGEPLFISEEGGWRPYVPLLDQFLAVLGRPRSAGPLRIYTSEGVTEVLPPETLKARLSAYWKISRGFPDIAKLRNWRSQLQESPSTYLKALEELGFQIRLRPMVGVDGTETTIDPAAQRFFPVVLPILPPEIWTRLKEYFISVYDNSIFELAVFVAAAFSYFLGRHYYSTQSVKRVRRRIPLIVGGWGTRGKSGTERLKAALFNALGYAVVSKTTGCEAMFLCAHAFGKTREMFLFRSYDKATIWEQRNVLTISDKLGAEVFLWECMALTPSYVEVLQQDWVMDDLSTITNTYPDHEDLQGPAGINIPEVIGVFIPTRSRAVTTEEVMLPILTEIAKEKRTPLRNVGWIEPGLIAPDVLKRFPYDEHPCNVALVLAVAEELGIRQDFALKEMADRVVPDLGVLKTSPVATIRGRRLQFSNGCSANERHGTISNWIRCGFDKQDPVAEPGVWITTVVNNRADRVPRSRVFARILVEDVYADRHFLIGGNLTGLVGYIKQSWDAYAPTISLWPKDAPEDPNVVLREMARRFRVPFEWSHLLARLKSMISAGESPLDVSSLPVEVLRDPQALRLRLDACGLGGNVDAILQHHGANLEAFDAFESFRSRIANVAQGERPIIDNDFRALLWVWFQKKLVVVHDYYISGEQLINKIAEETPPGYMNRVMGVQNIKGTGLDFVYRWQAWDTCWKACDQLQSPDPATAEKGLRALAAFHEFGVLSQEHVRKVLAAVKQSSVAQNESFQSELAVVCSNFEMAMKELQQKLTAVRKQAGKLEKFAGYLEAFLDAGDAVRRRKFANQVYRDLIELRISYERAALELQHLNKRQKGGWLLQAISAAQSLLARKATGLLLRSVK